MKTTVLVSSAKETERRRPFGLVGQGAKLNQWAPGSVSPCLQTEDRSSQARHSGRQISVSSTPAWSTRWVPDQSGYTVRAFLKEKKKPKARKLPRNETWGDGWYHMHVCLPAYTHKNFWLPLFFPSTDQETSHLSLIGFEANSHHT